MSTTNRRRLAVNASAQVDAHAALKDKARRAYILNNEKNKFTNDYNKARKEVFTEMEQLKLTELPIEATDTLPALVAKVSQEESTYIDIKLLKSLVSEEIFMKIIKATIGDVDTYAGKQISARASKTKLSEPNVKIAKQN